MVGNPWCSAATLAAALLAIPSAGLAQIPNDDCQDAIPLALPSLTAGTTVGAGSDGAFPDCMTDLSAVGVWYSLTGSGNEVTATLCENQDPPGSADYDTKINVYCVSCDEPMCVAGNDDEGGCDYHSTVTFCTQAGAEYRILVQGYDGEIGSFELSVFESGGACAPTAPCLGEPLVPNDHCAQADSVGVPSTTAGTTIGASVDELPGCFVDITAPGVWYSVEGTGDTMFATTTCGPTDFDATISVYCFECGQPRCITTSSPSGCESTAIWCSQDGADYYILVHGDEETGNFELSIFDTTSCSFSTDCMPEPPTNDLCQDAIPLSIPSLTSGSTVEATIEVGVPDCYLTLERPGVWYSVIGTGKMITASMCDDGGGGFSDFDTAIEVYCGDCDTPMCVSGNDDGSGDICGFSSKVGWCSQDGAEYFILVHNAGFPGGYFDLGLYEDGSCSAPVDCTDGAGLVNDDCGDATPLEVPSLTSGTTVPALPDFGVPECDGLDLDAPAVWYSVMGTGTTMTATTCSDTGPGAAADFDTRLSVYRGTCSGMICVAANDDDDGCDPPDGNDGSTVTWCAAQGLTYLIMVHADDDDGKGEFTLSVFDDEVACVACPGDSDLSGVVDVDDLVEIILNWGCSGACPGDVNGDLVVNVDDIILVILSWGPCS